MASQPNTQPQKVLRQTTLFSFRSKPSAMAVIATAPECQAAEVASPSVCAMTTKLAVDDDEANSTAAVRRTLFDSHAAGGGGKPQYDGCGGTQASSAGDDDDEDVMLGTIVARSTTPSCVVTVPAQSSAQQSKRQRDGEGDGSAHPKVPNAPAAAHAKVPNAPAGRRQLQLDFGQTIRTADTCALCGMVFTNTETDLVLHRKRCRPLAAAEEGRQRKAFVDELFADCGGGDETNPDGGRGRRGQQATAASAKRCGRDQAAARKRHRGTSSALSLLEAAAAAEWGSTLVRIVPPTTMLSLADAHARPWSVALLDGNAAHRWGKTIPTIVEQLVNKMNFGPSLSLMADAQRLAVQDAAASESYLEHRRNVLVVLVLDNSRGGDCVAAVVGAEMFRQQESERIDGGDGAPQVVMRRSTRCDVLQAWEAPTPSPAQHAAGNKRAFPIHSDPSPVHTDRMALLFENIVGPTNKGGDFWARGAKRSEPSVPKRTTTALQAALEALGKHIIYGCRVDWRSEMCYAQGLLTDDADSAAAAMPCGALDELLEGHKGRQYRFAWDIDAEFEGPSMLLPQGVGNEARTDGGAHSDGGDLLSGSSSACCDSSDDGGSM